MPEPILVDTNVLLRHLMQDIPDHSARSTALMHQARLGQVALFAPASVFVELTHYLHRTKKIPRRSVTAALLQLLAMQGVSSDHPEAIREALVFWERNGPLSFPDCFHLALAKQLGMPSIYTFDQKMGRFPGVTRIEPS